VKRIVIVVSLHLKLLQEVVLIPVKLIAPVSVYPYMNLFADVTVLAIPIHVLPLFGVALLLMSKEYVVINLKNGTFLA
jgi:hypothetical protein